MSWSSPLPVPSPPTHTIGMVVVGRDRREGRTLWFGDTPANSQQKLRSFLLFYLLYGWLLSFHRRDWTGWEEPWMDLGLGILGRLYSRYTDVWNGVMIVTSCRNEKLGPTRAHSQKDCLPVIVFRKTSLPVLVKLQSTVSRPPRVSTRTSQFRR